MHSVLHTKYTYNFTCYDALMHTDFTYNYLHDSDSEWNLLLVPHFGFTDRKTWHLNVSSQNPQVFLGFNEFILASTERFTQVLLSYQFSMKSGGTRSVRLLYFSLIFIGGLQLHIHVHVGLKVTSLVARSSRGRWAQHYSTANLVGLDRGYTVQQTWAKLFYKIRT
jgi:hypothetical protein